MISSQRNIKALLSALHTPGLDTQTDRMTSKFLGMKEAKVDVLVHSLRQAFFFGKESPVDSFMLFSANESCIQSYHVDVPHAIWCISPTVTTIRLLAITSLLRTLASREGMI